MTSFAAMFFMMFAHDTNRCMDYTADKFNINGQICMHDATWSAFNSPQFICHDGVAIKNEDESLLAVYQCGKGISLVFHGSQRKGDWGQVMVYDKLQRLTYHGNITSAMVHPE